MGYAAATASPATHTQSTRAIQSGGSRFLMLVGVALCTMIVVILAGLVVMSLTD
jgi:hypothetical protein